METQIQDIEHVCIECNNYYLWTAGEQKFLNKLVEDKKIEKATPPKRCPACRLAKRQARES